LILLYTFHSTYFLTAINTKEYILLSIPLNTKSGAGLPIASVLYSSAKAIKLVQELLDNKIKKSKKVFFHFLNFY